MITKVYLYSDGEWDSEVDSSMDTESTLVVIFGCSDIGLVQEGYDEIISKFPNSIIMGCSTAGEIYQDELHKKSLSVAVMKFQKSKIKLNVTSEICN